MLSLYVINIPLRNISHESIYTFYSKIFFKLIFYESGILFVIYNSNVYTKFEIYE